MLQIRMVYTRKKFQVTSSSKLTRSNVQKYKCNQVFIRPSNKKNKQPIHNGILWHRLLRNLLRNGNCKFFKQPNVRPTCYVSLERTSWNVNIASILDDDQVVTWDCRRVCELITFTDLVTLKLHFGWTINSNCQCSGSSLGCVNDKFGGMAC
jgi:hypothetical protein